MKALLSVNGTPVPGTTRMFKLNWATGGGLGDKNYHGPEYSIFVGDLGPEVNDYILHATFYQRYPSCRSAKVVTDAMSGLSRGYGFVRFTDENEQQRAMVEMQGQLCAGRPMRISVATPKNRNMPWNAWMGGNGGVAYHPMPGSPAYGQPPQAMWSSAPYSPTSASFNDPTNTTVFVGGLVTNYVSEEDLRR